jgi:IclR-like helix-turn-helix domain-containing protein
MNSFSRDTQQKSTRTHSDQAANRWDFLTNHAHVLLSVSQDSGIRLREIAAAVGITERSAHKILSELVEEGYVLRERHGRRNRYKVKPELPLRHPLVQDREVGDLLGVLSRPERPARKGGRGSGGRARKPGADRATVR